MGSVKPLTERQRQVVALVRRGLTNAEIAGTLGITEDGVKAHLSRLYLRFDVTNRVALLAALDADEAPGSSTLGELRTLVGTSLARWRRLDDESGVVSGGVASIRDALAAVDVALSLVRELPPETTGPVLDALRRRVSAAIAALDAAQPVASAGSARAV